VGAKKVWPVSVDDSTRYKAALIAALLKLPVGQVIERAVACYANVIRVNDLMEQEFPKDGLEPPKPSGRRGRPPKLSSFQEHKDWFAARRGTPDKVQQTDLQEAKE